MILSVVLTFFSELEFSILVIHVDLRVHVITRELIWIQGAIKTMEVK